MSGTTINQTDRPNRPEMGVGLPEMKLALYELESTPLAAPGLSVPENDCLDRWKSHPSRGQLSFNHKVAPVSREVQVLHRIVGCPKSSCVASYRHSDLSLAICELCN